MTDFNKWLIDEGFGMPAEAFLLGLFLGWFFWADKL